MILLLDNYDSFTYNVAQLAEELGAEILVMRNDEVSVEEVVSLKPLGILISPGPCTPDKAGITEDLVRAFAGRTPVFGVCLGMQAIGEVYGGKIVRAKRIMHGKESAIHHEGKGVFEGLPSPFRAIRYHSLVVERTCLPDELEVTASADDGEIMGLRHRDLDVEGVQFHPESILSEHGRAIIGNWVRRVQNQSN
ncbi:MAG: aminodeoxychorismate/anthranilate synthase component II [Armatimonadetes bacterium]|nr:aminodeoxychorismate/anthranilate synthase component II [Armatimonadota bacterium]